MDAPITAPATSTTSTTPTLTALQQSLSDNQNIAAGQPGSPWSTPNMNSINSGNTAPTTPIVVPPPVVAPDTSAGIVGGANQTLAQAQASLTPAPTALDNQQSGLLNDIANLTGQDANKGDETQQLNDQYGVTSDNAALTAATNELATKTASYNALQANLGGAGGTSEGTAILAAQNAGLTKARAADIGITQAKITAAQGNLSLAQQQVTNAINLKYGDIEAQIKTKQAQLDAIAPNLSAEQKTQALAQQSILDQQKTQVATDKAAATQNLKLVVANNITQPFANDGGTIFDAQTGQAFSNPQDFFAAAGVSSFAQAYAQGLIGDIKDTGITLKTSNVNGQTVQFGYDKNGNVVSQTVLGTTTGTQKGGGSGGGNSTVVTYQSDGKGGINQVTTVNGKVTKTVQQKPTAGTTPPPSKVQTAITNLKSVSGSDGAVAPSTWNEALTQWLNAGYSLASFKSNFGSFAKNASSPLSDYNGM